MRYMILVKATKDSEAGVMPTDSLIAEMTQFHEEMAKAGVLVDGAGLKSREEAVEWTRRYPNPAGPGREAEIEVREFFEAEDFQ